MYSKSLAYSGFYRKGKGGTPNNREQSPKIMKFKPLTMVKLIKPKIVHKFPIIVTPSRMPAIESSPQYSPELFNLSIEWGGTAEKLSPACRPVNRTAQIGCGNNSRRQFSLKRKKPLL